jgi:chromosome segregation ATPase
LMIADYLGNQEEFLLWKSVAALCARFPGMVEADLDPILAPLARALEAAKDKIDTAEADSSYAQDKLEEAQEERDDLESEKQRLEKQIEEFSEKADQIFDLAVEITTENVDIAEQIKTLAKEIQG